MTDAINVLLVDDHAVVRTGYKTYLSLSGKIGAILEADRGEIACQLYNEHHSDIVVMDISMPGIGGFETMRRLLGRDPQCRILVFSIHDEPAYVSRALQSGAKGYIVKNSEPETLITAVCTISAGGTYVSPELAQQLAMQIHAQPHQQDPVHLLTAREFDIFCLLANGWSVREVAEKLHISSKTVSNNSTIIKDKLNIKTLAEMTLLANRHGLIKMP